MSQFDVHFLRDGIKVVNVQSDLVANVGTTFVIPLVLPDDDARTTKRLNPMIDLAGERHVLATHLAGAVSSSTLGRVELSLADHHLVIKSAIDMLISGY